MESNFNNRDFEQFIKESADQYRMFPSEKVWKGIDSALHTRRKWYGLGLALLLFLTGAGVTWVMITTPGNKDPKAVSQVLPNDPAAGGSKTLTPNKPVTPVTHTGTPFVYSNDQVKLSAGTSFDDIILNNDRADQNNNETTTLIPTSVAGSIIEETGSKLAAIAIQESPKTPPLFVENPDIIPFTSQSNSISWTNVPADNNTDNKTSTQTVTIQLPNDSYPLTIESVINSYKRQSTKKKIAIQAYFTPTISYRKLSENKEFLRSAAAAGVVPTYAAYNDVKNYVTHKPDIGLEVGLTAKYPLAKNLLIKAGLQFNVSRYDIRAFNSPSDTATIRLNGTGRDSSFSRTTIYQTRNNGNRANWLQNLYYNISIPIGAEFRFSNSRKTQFGVGATVQPTYVISDRAYLISTNYKNYMEVPGSILRRFNLNTGLEFFVDYSTDNYRWQIGPQIRYQTRSTFKDKYPVKENLFDFGVKVGVMLKK